LLYAEDEADEDEDVSREQGPAGIPFWRSAARCR